MNSNEMMKLAAKVYEGLSDKDIEEIERIALDRSNFCDERTKRLEELLKDIEDEDFLREIVSDKNVEKEIL
jgi:hypothetical protein